MEVWLEKQIILMEETDLEEMRERGCDVQGVLLRAWNQGDNIRLLADISADFVVSAFRWPMRSS